MDAFPPDHRSGICTSCRRRGVVLAILAVLVVLSPGVLSPAAVLLLEKTKEGGGKEQLIRDKGFE